jgi:hypothetical protein
LWATRIWMVARQGVWRRRRVKRAEVVVVVEGLIFGVLV